MKKLENFFFWFLGFEFFSFLLLSLKEPWLLDFSIHYGKILFYIKCTIYFCLTVSLGQKISERREYLILRV